MLSIDPADEDDEDDDVLNRSANTPGGGAHTPGGARTPVGAGSMMDGEATNMSIASGVPVDGEASNSMFSEGQASENATPQQVMIAFLFHTESQNITYWKKKKRTWACLTKLFFIYFFLFLITFIFYIYKKVQ